MKKDLLKLIITASVAAIFVGCGSSGKSTTTTPTVAPTTAPTATVAPTTAPTATVAPSTAPTANPAANDTSDPLPF